VKGLTVQLPIDLGEAMQQTDTMSQRLRHRGFGASKDHCRGKCPTARVDYKRHKPLLVRPRLAPPGRTIDAQAECSDSWIGNHAVASSEGKDSDTHYTTDW